MVFLNSVTYVTGFEKTFHVHTRIEIHFIAYYNSHTQALSRHSDAIAIDKQVCFYKRLFANPVKSWRTIIDAVRPLRGINRVAWGSILSHCTSAQLMARGIFRATVAICLAHCAHNLVACVWGHH